MMQARYRCRLNSRTEGLWEPEWDNEIVSWTRSFIRQNKWRTQTFYDEEDLFHEAFLVFMKVKKTYPRVVDAKLFMRMYQTSLWRRFMDCGRKLKNDILSVRHAQREAVLFTPEMVAYNAGPLAVALMEGPPEFRLLLEFISDDANLEKLREPQRHRVGNQPRKNIDQRLSALIGIPDFPFREALRRWLFA
jgi:hypothetical protein